MQEQVNSSTILFKSIEETTIWMLVSLTARGAESSLGYMEGTEVALQDMLECRERRAYLQRDLLGRYEAPVISFTMNIPGPVKTDASIRKAFEQGKTELLSRLSGYEVNECLESHERTGDELLVSVRAEARTLKLLTTEIEEETRYGRLFDMDVLDADGEKLSRPVFRKCLICDSQAQEMCQVTEAFCPGAPG